MSMASLCKASSPLDYPLKCCPKYVGFFGRFWIVYGKVAPVWIYGLECFTDFQFTFCSVQEAWEISFSKKVFECAVKQSPGLIFSQYQNKHCPFQSSWVYRQFLTFLCKYSFHFVLWTEVSSVQVSSNVTQRKEHFYTAGWLYTTVLALQQFFWAVWTKWSDCLGVHHHFLFIIPIYSWSAGKLPEPRTACFNEPISCLC